MTCFDVSRLPRAGAVVLASVLTIACAEPSVAQSRPLTIRKVVRPAPVIVVIRPQRGLDVTANRPLPSWAWASMATSPVWSYDDRFNAPLDRRLFFSGPRSPLFTF